MTMRDRHPLDELAEEFAARLRRGETASIENYAARHPHLADEIRELFPALAMMERLKPDSGEEATGSFAGAVGSLPAGTVRFGDYRILREVGRGGMGVVYEAEQISLGRRVALKVLPTHGLLDGRQIDRFRREAQAAGRLHHTNIVPVFGVGEQDGIPYFVMQFIAGQSLHRVIEELRRLRSEASKTSRGGESLTARGSGDSAGDVALSLTNGFLSGGEALRSHTPHPSYDDSSSGAAALPGQTDLSSASRSGAPYWRSVAQIGVQLADALAYAHAQEVLHRDIKPSNLLLDARGEVWVADFGLARLGEGGDLTATGDVLGTLRYMAPEALRGEYDRRSDIYGAGLTLYELLTLRPAFGEAERGKLFSQVAEASALPPRRIDPHIPRDLETIVLKAISREPAHRYQYADQLADDLRRFLEDRPILARRAGPIERAWRWRRRNPAVATWAGMFLLALFLGLFGVSWKWRDAEDARRVAERRTQETQRLLARQYVDNGVRHLDEDDPHGAAVWFAEALRQDAGDPDREEMHRIRLATIFRNTPRLSQMLFHEGEVRHALYSPDGRRLLTAAGNAARLWDAATGEPLTPPIPHEQHIWTSMLAPDGKRFLTLSADPNFPSRESSELCEARLYDAETGKLALLPLAPGDMQPRPAAFTPDGGLFITRGETRVHVWDAAAGQLAFAPLEHPAKVRWFAFSPNGSRLATWSSDYDEFSEVSLWDMATGTVIGQPLADQELGYGEHGFSRDGKRLVTIRYCPNVRRPTEGVTFGATVWDAGAGATIGAPIESEAPFLSAALTPDGTQVITQNHPDRNWKNVRTEFRLWDVEQGTAVACELTGHTVTGNESEPVFSPKGDRVALRGADLVEFTLPKGKRNVAFPGVEGAPEAYSPDGRRLLVSKSGWDAVGVADVATQEVQRLAVGYGLFRAAFHPEGDRFVVYGVDRATRVWSLAGSDPQLLPWEQLHRDDVTHLAQSRDGRLLAVLSGPNDLAVSRSNWEDRGAVRIYDVASGKLVSPSLEMKARIHGGAFTADGRRLLVWDCYAGLSVIHVQSGTVAVTLEPVERKFNAYPNIFKMHAAFSRDGRIVAGYSGDGKLYLWDASSGRQLGPPRPLPEHELVQISPDGDRVLVSTAAGETMILATGTLAPAAKLGQIVPPPTSAVFSPSGRLVATVGRDFACRVWDAETGRLAAPLVPQAIDVGFSFDERLLLTGGVNRSARVWDVQTGEPVTPAIRTAVLPGEHDAEAGCLFGPDSRSVFTIADGHIRRWSLVPDRRPVDDLLRLAQLGVGRRIDEVGGYSPWGVEHQQSAWQELSQRFGASALAPTDEERRAWRQRESWEASHLLKAK